jgi:transcriptional regulator with XRE-family HTH domain
MALGSAVEVVDRSVVQFPHVEIGVRFGRVLKNLRRSRGLTQLDMAIGFGIDRSYISDVECGKKGVSLATLEVIALGFDLELSDLLREI